MKRKFLEYLENGFHILCIYFYLLNEQRKLSALERLSNRLGYSAAALIMVSPYLLKYDNIGAYTYIVGGILALPQVWIAKQWNLVIVNLNVTLGYIIYLYTT